MAEQPTTRNTTQQKDSTMNTEKLKKRYTYKCSVVNKAGGMKSDNCGSADNIAEVTKHIFSDKNYAVEAYSVEQLVTYWTYSVYGTKGGTKKSVVRYSERSPEEFSDMMAEILLGYDVVYNFTSGKKEVSRQEFDMFYGMNVGFFA